MILVLVRGSRWPAADVANWLCLLENPFLLRQLMLRPALNTLLGDDVAACRWTKTHRFLARSRRPATAPSWRFRRSVASISDTNGARPDRPSPHRPDAHERRTRTAYDWQAGSCCYDDTPAVRPPVKIATVATLSTRRRLSTHAGRRAPRRQRRAAQRIDGVRRSDHGTSMHGLPGRLTLW